MVEMVLNESNIKRHALYDKVVYIFTEEELKDRQELLKLNLFRVVSSDNKQFLVIHFNGESAKQLVLKNKYCKLPLKVYFQMEIVSNGISILENEIGELK